ncbi:hypothetical protein IKF15_04425 [Candidatus Saccharibacteria bacterium]|nr:hypothetical protein [Candidatus Saccharibacteria bacterium]
MRAYLNNYREPYFKKKDIEGLMESIAVMEKGVRDLREAVMGVWTKKEVFLRNDSSPGEVPAELYRLTCCVMEQIEGIKHDFEYFEKRSMFNASMSLFDGDICWLFTGCARRIMQWAIENDEESIEVLADGFLRGFFSRRLSEDDFRYIEGADFENELLPNGYTFRYALMVALNGLGIEHNLGKCLKSKKEMEDEYKIVAYSKMRAPRLSRNEHSYCISYGILSPNLSDDDFSHIDYHLESCAEALSIMEVVKLRRAGITTWRDLSRSTFCGELPETVDVDHVHNALAEIGDDDDGGLFDDGESFALFHCYRMYNKGEVDLDTLRVLASELLSEAYRIYSSDYNSDYSYDDFVGHLSEDILKNGYGLTKKAIAVLKEVFRVANLEWHSEKKKGSAQLAKACKMYVDWNKYSSDFVLNGLGEYCLLRSIGISSIEDIKEADENQLNEWIEQFCVGGDGSFADDEDDEDEKPDDEGSRYRDPEEDFDDWWEKHRESERSRRIAKRKERVKNFFEKLKNYN